MESELKRSEMTCPVNGEICCDGIRDDFKANDKGIKKQCRLWTAVKGKDPQGENVIDFFDCAWAWMPVVGLEQSQMTRHNTATVQEFRNETQKNMSALSGAMKQAAIALNDVADNQREMLEAVPLPALENKENNGHDN